MKRAPWQDDSGCGARSVRSVLANSASACSGALGIWVGRLKCSKTEKGTGCWAARPRQLHDRLEPRSGLRLRLFGPGRVPGVERARPGRGNGLDAQEKHPADLGLHSPAIASVWSAQAVSVRADSWRGPKEIVLTNKFTGILVIPGQGQRIAHLAGTNQIE